MEKGIPPENFYGKKTARQERIEAILKKESTVQNKSNFTFRLLGPSTTWKVFKKQQDALDCCRRRCNGLMAFAFEDINARRMFLVAHPKMFWALNSHRFFKNCNSYEIIQEYAACKLYLDIEFEYSYNNDKNGNLMLRTLLNIINFSLKFHFNINCSDDDILDLDSSSNVKFSHHIIYQIKNAAFQDNYAVGYFIKMICEELKKAFENNFSGDQSKIKELSNKFEVSEKEILQLFVKDSKGQTKLLLDEGVYTKNRHFRLLGSSKQAKAIPLRISELNKYKPNITSNSIDCCYFLDSLITYFSWKIERVLDFKLESLKQSKVDDTATTITTTTATNIGKDRGIAESMIYPQIDSFINKLISPNGRIRRKVFFSSSSVIVFDIQGFRYCENIKRHHKSNNIKYVVDLQHLGFYQKCYDPDCADFRSDMKPLPDEIQFLLKDDAFFVDQDAVNFGDFAEEDFMKAIEEITSDYNFEESISDLDLGNIVDNTEAVLDVIW